MLVTWTTYPPKHCAYDLNRHSPTCAKTGRRRSQRSSASIGIKVTPGHQAIHPRPARSIAVKAPKLKITVRPSRQTDTDRECASSPPAGFQRFSVNWIEGMFWRMKNRSPNLSARISHLGARKPPIDEAIAKLERARRVFRKPLRSHQGRDAGSERPLLAFR
jgi:hypothetical protein